MAIFSVFVILYIAKPFWSMIQYFYCTFLLYFYYRKTFDLMTVKGLGGVDLVLADLHLAQSGPCQETKLQSSGYF